MRLDVNYIIDNYRKIMNVIFVILIAITLAFITSKIVAMAAEKEFKLDSIQDSVLEVRSDLVRAQRSLSYYSPIIERNIFDSENRQPAASEKSEPAREYKPIDETPSYSGPPVKSTMNATLVGTMVFSNPSYSFAKIVRGSSSGDADSFYPGDSLFGEATIKRVERNKVYIRREGRIEYLEIEGPSASVMPSYSRSRPSSSYRKPSKKPANQTKIDDEDVRKVGDNKYVLERKMVDSLLSNYNQVLTQARAVPNYKDGKANGFKIFAIRGKSIYSAIGIKNGDVLTRVNGSEINNLEKVLSLFTQLRNESNITIDLERGGQKMSYEYEIR